MDAADEDAAVCEGAAGGFAAVAPEAGEADFTGTEDSIGASGAGGLDTRVVEMGAAGGEDTGVRVAGAPEVADVPPLGIWLFTASVFACSGFAAMGFAASVGSDFVVSDLAVSIFAGAPGSWAF